MGASGPGCPGACVGRGHRPGWLVGASVSYWKPWAPKRDLYCIREYRYYIQKDSLFDLIKESIVFGVIRGYVKHSAADIIFSV